MRRCAIAEKLKSTRGSGIAEALVGFLIAVLSVMILLGIMTATTGLIKDGDTMLTRLYAEEGAMEEFCNIEDLDDLAEEYKDLGNLYESYHDAAGNTVNYTVTVNGVSGEPTESENEQIDVTYFETLRHHLFGFRRTPNP